MKKITLLLLFMVSQVYSQDFSDHIIDNVTVDALATQIIDLDGDGDLDIITAFYNEPGTTSTGKLIWYENDGSQNYTQHNVDTAINGAIYLTAADVNGDSKIDILVNAYDGNALYAFINNGGTPNTFLPKITIDGSATGSNYVAANDFDGDSVMDAVSANYSGNELAWYKYTPPLTITKNVIDSAATLVASVESGDMDGDGDMDLVTTGDNQVFWYENNGLGAFTKHTIPASASFTGAITAYMFDFDTDGDVDIIASASGANEVAWFENDGSEVFTKHIVATGVNYASYAKPVDFNNDGNMDIVVSATTLDKLFWFENDGTDLVFTQHLIGNGNPLGDAYGLDVADMDGDGDMDIALASPGPNIFRWLENDFIGPPANDVCTNAFPVTCGNSYSGDTTDATDNGDDLSTHTGMGKGIWYKYIGDDNTVTIDISNQSVDMEVGVAASADCVTFTGAASSDVVNSSSTESITFDADAGTTYYIYVAYYSNTSSTTGTFDLAVSCVPYPPYPTVSTLAALRAGVIGNPYEFTGEGFATMVRLSASGNGSIRVFGQDATAGMQFYAPAGIITAPSINFGDGVTSVKGTLTEQYGTLVFVVEVDIVMTGNNQTIIPEEVTAIDYVNNREDYESELIKIINATINPNGDTNFVQNNQYALTDVTAGNVTLGVAFPQLNGVIPTLANVTGIAVEYNTTSVILPRGDTDIEALTCSVPSNLSASNITDVSADLAWTAGLNTDTTWDIEWGIAGFTPGTSSQTGSATSTASNPYSAGSLAQTTNYEFYVRTVCIAGNGDWVGPFSFTTIATPPTNDDCSTATVVFCSDSLAGETTIGATDNGDDLSTELGMGKGIWYKYIGNDNTVTIDISNQSVDMEVGVAASADCVTFTGAVSSDSVNSSSTESITFDADNGTTYYIYVAYYGNTSSLTGTFDLAVSCVPYPTCPDVTNINVSNMTGTNADLSWDTVAEVTTGYNWEIQPQGTAQGDGALVEGGTTATNSVTAAALVNGISYTLYVQTDCDPDGTSNYSSYNFTFILPPVNDDCLGATLLLEQNNMVDYASTTPYAGTISGATDSGLAATSCDGWIGTANDDVWFKFTATTSAIHITLEDDFDGVMNLFDGDCTTLNLLDCADNGATPQIDATGLTVGNTYFIRVYNYSSSTTSTPSFNISVWSEDAVVSTNDLSSVGFKYYPNPVTNNLTINANENITNIAIYNLLGQEVKQVNLSSLNAQIDMSSLVNGTYFIKATVGNAVGTFKVVKK